MVLALGCTPEVLLSLLPSRSGYVSQIVSVQILADIAATKVQLGTDVFSVGINRSSFVGS